MSTPDVSKPGLWVAFAATLVATSVGIVSQATDNYDLHGPCLMLFASAIVVLSGAAVNFEPVRIRK